MKALLGALGGTLRTLFKLLGAVFARLSVCALTGGVVGSFAGFLYIMFRSDNPAATLATQDLVLIGLILGLVGFLLILFLVGLLLQYGVNNIFWGALVNSLLTAIVTVQVVEWLGFPALAGLAGLLIGTAIGTLLCWLCRLIEGKVYAKA